MLNKTARSITEATLALIALGGVITVTVMAPGLGAVLGRKIKRDRINKYLEYRKIWQNFYSLKKRNDIKFIETKNGHDVYSLTEAGEKKVIKLLSSNLKIKKPEKWDHKWRLVMFDIPEKRGKSRRAFTKKLKEMDFFQCQKSAWIHPFACLEEIEFVKDMLNIKPYVKLFLVEEMTDGKVLYHFSKILR